MARSPRSTGSAARARRSARRLGASNLPLGRPVTLPGRPAPRTTHARPARTSSHAPRLGGLRMSRSTLVALAALLAAPALLAAQADSPLDRGVGLFKEK